MPKHFSLTRFTILSLLFGFVVAVLFDANARQFHIHHDLIIPGGLAVGQAIAVMLLYEDETDT